MPLPVSMFVGPHFDERLVGDCLFSVESCSNNMVMMENRRVVKITRSRLQSLQ